MRVLLVHSIGRMGGAERSLVELAEALRGLGVRLAAAVPAGDLSESLRAIEIPVARVPETRLRRVSGGPAALWALLRLLPAAASVARMTARHRPDVIHAGNPAAAMAVLLAARRRTRTWHLRDLRLPPGFPRLARRMTAMVAVSEAVQRAARDCLPEDQRPRVHLIRNGIDVAAWGHPADPAQRAAARRALGLPARAPVIGMLAHIVPWKRHDFFIQTAAVLAARQPDVHFAIAGSALFGEHRAYRQRLDALAGPLGARLARYERAVDPKAFLRAVDLVFHPALEEAFGRVLCEAMCAATPVAAMRAGGPAEILADGQAGVLLDPDATPAQAADVLAGVLGAPGRLAAMAAAGPAQVRARFDMRRTAAELLALFDTLPRAFFR